MSRICSIGDGTGDGSEYGSRDGGQLTSRFSVLPNGFQLF